MTYAHDTQALRTDLLYNNVLEIDHGIDCVSLESSR
jgi:hypothetical protein